VKHRIIVLLNINRFCKPLTFPMRCFSVLLTCNGKIKINQRTSSPCPKGSAENIRTEVLDFSHVEDDNARQIYQANVRNFALHKHTHIRRTSHQFYRHRRKYSHFFFAQELSVRGPADEFCVVCLDYVIRYIHLGLTKK